MPVTSERARLEKISADLLGQFGNTIADSNASPRARAEAVVGAAILLGKAPANLSEAARERLVRQEEVTQRMSPQERALCAKLDAGSGGLLSTLPPRIAARAAAKGLSR
jgi:hypothetical protein